MDRSRRSVLVSSLGASAVALAGCLGGGDARSFSDHPSSTGVDRQPTLGTIDRPGVIVAFEDPSCPSCRRFEAETFPRLYDELIEPGDVAFVFRTIDVIYPWATPASQLMASAYAADAAAFWALKGFYYREQPSFDSGNVVDRSESFLAEETSVDAGAVVQAARERAHDDLIQANREAADAVGLEGTPLFFLFRDDEFRTEVSGPQAYDVFANALGFES